VSESEVWLNRNRPLEVIALVHMGLGEREAAIDRLETAYRDHAFELAHVNLTPVFDPLRADPRFQNLITKIGLTAANRN
jgi:hypothetical protein